MTVDTLRFRLSGWQARTQATSRLLPYGTRRVQGLALRSAKIGPPQVLSSTRTCRGGVASHVRREGATSSAPFPNGPAETASTVIV